MDYTVYSDFTCAECHALNEQFVALGVSGTVRWRGVQHEPTLPVPMHPFDHRAQSRIEDEIADVRRRLTGIVMNLPPGKPNTARAIVALASVIQQHPATAVAFRDALYRAYWHEGADLSVMAELQRVADLAAVPRSVDLDDPAAGETVEDWELDWAMERLGGVPRVIRGDGQILWGLKPMAEAAAFLRA